LGFKQYYLWLKYTILTPSFFFKNRFFIDKSFRNNYVYSDPSKTQKSFQWTRLNTSVLSVFWFQISWKRLSLYFIIFVLLTTLLLVLNQSHTKHFLPLFMQPIFYILWRFLDLFYFFLLYLQYLIIISLFSLAFTLTNLIASTDFNIIRWMQKYHAETPLNSTKLIAKKIIPTVLTSLTNLDYNSLHFSAPTNTDLNIEKNYYNVLFLNFFFYENAKISWSASGYKRTNLVEPFRLKNESYSNDAFLPITSEFLCFQNPHFYFDNISGYSATPPLHKQFKHMEDSLIQLVKTKRWLNTYNNLHRSDVNFIETNSFTDISGLQSNLFTKPTLEWCLSRNLIFSSQLLIDKIPAHNKVLKSNFKPSWAKNSPHTSNFLRLAAMANSTKIEFDYLTAQGAYDLTTRTPNAALLKLNTSDLLKKSTIFAIINSGYTTETLSPLYEIKLS